MNESTEIKTALHTAPNQITLKKAVIKKIGHQFGTSPEQQLMFAVVAQAIGDIIDHPDKRSVAHSDALLYLSGNIPHAEICGVNADWIRRVLRSADLIK